MGKATKWFRGLFGLKKPSSAGGGAGADSDRKPASSKRRWSFVKSCKNDTNSFCQNDAVVSASAAADGGLSPSMKESAEEHAIAVAAATAAAAEAAVAAAQAAAAVVRLTSCRAAPAYVSGGCAGIREEWAAVRIQSAFRGCLARRALRALKGLVKLQALVRGHIERKRMTEWLHRMHVMMEAQARAIVGRKELQLTNPIPFNHTGPATPEKCEHIIRSRSRKHEQSSLLRRNSSKSNGRANSDDHYKAHSYESQFDEKSGYLRSSSVRNVAITDDEKSDKILEIDTGKPRTITPKRRNLFHSNDQNSRSFTTSKDSTTHHTLPSPSSCEVQSSLAPLKLEDSLDVEEGSFCTANNSPQFFSASSRGGGGSSRRSPFTPSKSDGSTSFLIGYSDYPNYMSYTESSKAKVRSVSAPKQRPQYERSSSTKRYSIQGIGESKPSGQKSSALHMNFMNKAYPGSGRLDKLGMPIGYRYY